MKLLHLDDHVLFSEGLSAVFKQQNKNLTVLSVYTVEDAFKKLTENDDIDVIIIDLYLPGLDGYAFLQGLEERHIFIPAVILSATVDLWKIRKALKAGASGFIPKTYSINPIISILERIMAGEIVIPEDIQRSLCDMPSLEPTQEKQRILTAHQLGQRQLDVLKLMQQGYANEEIASVLNLSVNTIKTHARTLFKSFQVANRLECVRYAERLGLFD